MIYDLTVTKNQKTATEFEYIVWFKKQCIFKNAQTLEKVYH